LQEDLVEQMDGVWICSHKRRHDMELESHWQIASAMQRA
jgi:hypothetical protein